MVKLLVLIRQAETLKDNCNIITQKEDMMWISLFALRKNATQPNKVYYTLFCYISVIVEWGFFYGFFKQQGL